MRFIVVGAGLYGAVLAYKLRTSGRSVTLIDGSGKALSAWKCANIGSVDVNPGFHIIERDRNKCLVEFLQQEIKSDFLEIENYRSIAIGTVARNYAYGSVGEDPVVKDPFGSLIMRPDIPEKLSKPCDLVPYFSQETKHILRIIANTRGFQDLHSFCSHIFPWFYPGRYDLLNAIDEGSRFNSPIRSGDRVHVGLMPRSGLFSDLSSQINDRLRELCIPIVSKRFADHSDIRSLVSSNTRVIVTLPAPVVLESKPRLSLYLLAYSLGVNTKANWLEMPVLSPSVPYLTRIFKGLSDEILYCECLLNELSNETTSEVQRYLHLLFQDPCQFIGSSWIRYVYRPSSEQLDAAKRKVQKLTDGTDIVWHNPASWPENTSKQYNRAIHMHRELI